MNIIRSHSDVILHDVFVALEESIDQYVDGAEFLGKSSLAEFFKELSAERLVLLEQLGEIIHNTGHLPPAADNDKESLRFALQHFFANFADNAILEVLEQCLNQEREVAATFKQLLTIESTQSDKLVFKAIYKSHRFARLYLCLLCEHYRNPAL